MTNAALDVLDKALTKARADVDTVTQAIADLELRLEQRRAELAIRDRILADHTAAYDAVAALVTTPEA